MIDRLQRCFMLIYLGACGFAILAVVVVSTV